MLRLLNASWAPGQRLGGLLERIRGDWGFHGLRAGVPVGLDVRGQVDLLRELSGQPAVIILGGWQAAGEGAAEVYRHRDLSPDELYQDARRFAWASKQLDASGWFVEAGNEPDLTDPISRNPRAAAERVRAVLEGLRAEGSAARVISPGVSNLNRGGGFDYVVELLRHVPPEVLGGIHPYRTHVEPWAKFKGWARIQDAVWELRKAHPRRDWAVTEIGWHNGAQWRGWGPWRREWRFSPEQVAEFFTWEHNFWAAERAILWVWYQINDGPTDEALDRYGVRTIDDQDKPVADAARQFREV